MLHMRYSTAAHRYTLFVLERHGERGQSPTVDSKWPLRFRRNRFIKGCTTADFLQQCLISFACEAYAFVLLHITGSARCGRGRGKRNLQSLWKQNYDLHQSLPEIWDPREYSHERKVRCWQPQSEQSSGLHLSPVYGIHTDLTIDNP